MIFEGAATGIVLSGLLAGQARYNPRPPRDSDAALTAGDLNDSFACTTVRTENAGGTTIVVPASGDGAGAATRAALDSLRAWARDPGEEAPSAAAISKAMRLVAATRAEVTAPTWTEPAVTASESGEVVLEWRNRGRRITAYILEDAAEAIRSWGPSPTADMDVVACDDAGTLAGLLSWVAEAGDGTAGG